MADRSKFEQMLELLINEDKAAAQELFHEIVVEKSRDIYESLLEDEDEIEEDSDEEVSEDDEEVDEAADEEVDESDEDLEEGFSLDEFEVEADDEVGGDATDDMMGDLGMDDEEGDEEGEEGDEGDVEDRVEDLEDALDDLKAEFEKMMAGEDGEEADDEEADDEEGEEADDMDMGDEEEAPEESFQATVTPLTAGEQMREYVEKVSPKMGDNGANTTSTLAKPNNMGGTSANIAKGGTADTKGTAGGLASNKPQAMNTKNVNVVGAKGATKMSAQPGHGAEKSGKPETAANTKSTISK